MKTPRSLLLALCAVAAFSPALGTTVIPPTFDELVGRADVIFQGTVSDVKSQWAGEGGQRHIVTYVTFSVEDTLKGTPGESYTLRMLGGTVGDQTMEVTDTPKFKTGDRDILFVEKNGSQFIPLVGISHGRFRVQTDAQTGSEFVTTGQGEPVGDLMTLGQEAHEEASPAPADLDSSQRAESFKAAIAAKLATGS